MTHPSDSQGDPKQQAAAMAPLLLGGSKHTLQSHLDLCGVDEALTARSQGPEHFRGTVILPTTHGLSHLVLMEAR